MTVGAIEEILIEETFINTQNSFCVKHCDKFDDTEENKIVYTTLFEEYTELMESMLNTRLENKIPVRTAGCLAQ
jgi:ADP-ribosylation factor-like protein 2-binding protein